MTSPRTAIKYSIGPYVRIGLCSYFCFEIRNSILQKINSYDIFFHQFTLLLALVSGIVLSVFIEFVLITVESIYNNLVKRYENDKNLKLTQLKRKARRKCPTINQKEVTLNDSFNLRVNQRYRIVGSIYSPDINLLNDEYIITKRVKPGSTKYTVKCMFKDIAKIGFVSLLLHGKAILLQIHLNLLFLLCSALLTFGVAHLWVGVIWPFINWTLVNFWLTLDKAFNFFR
jgi:hypothetical protein